MHRRTIRLTMAQALVKWLTVQMTEIEGARVPLFGGVFDSIKQGPIFKKTSVGYRLVDSGARLIVNPPRTNI